MKKCKCIHCLWNKFSDSNKNYSNLEKFLFGAVKWTGKADIEKHKYSGYGIGFDGHGTFLFLTGRFGCNIIIFEVLMSEFFCTCL